MKEQQNLFDLPQAQLEPRSIRHLLKSSQKLERGASSIVPVRSQG